MRGRLLAPASSLGLAKQTVAAHLRHFLSKLEESEAGWKRGKPRRWWASAQDAGRSQPAMLQRPPCLEPTLQRLQRLVPTTVAVTPPEVGNRLTGYRSSSSHNAIAPTCHASRVGSWPSSATAWRTSRVASAPVSPLIPRNHAAVLIAPASAATSARSASASTANSCASIRARSATSSATVSPTTTDSSGSRNPLYARETHR